MMSSSGFRKTETSYSDAIPGGVVEDCNPANKH